MYNYSSLVKRVGVLTLLSVSLGFFSMFDGWFGSAPDPVSGDCPDGFNDCGGCCVPYACPESQLES